MSDSVTPDPKRFDYMGWALDCASQLLMNDVDCGLEVADGTPDGDKARDYVMRVARRLSREAARRKKR